MKRKSVSGSSDKQWNDTEGKYYCKLLLCLSCHYGELIKCYSHLCYNIQQQSGKCSSGTNIHGRLTKMLMTDHNIKLLQSEFAGQQCVNVNATVRLTSSNQQACSKSSTDAFQVNFPERRLLDQLFSGTSFDTSVLSSINVTDDLAGKIESLQMVNFMCHSNLELKFNKRVNFITGRNGSGKSAIMAALIVVLGGSASLTNRGSGITDFIKKGENWAKVTITLINEGLNSFKKDVYGPRVIICRNISSSGSHGYVCKSATGCVVSKKKEEVDNIVLAFNLQIKNPICVLNQDVARSFLCATDNSLRFTMFSKATQLEQLKTIYMKTLELLVLSKKHLTVKQKGIQEASVEINQLKEKLELFASLEKRVHERTSLENEYLWAMVATEESKQSRLLEKKEELVSKTEEYLEGESNYENVLKELEEEVKKCQRGLEEGKNEKNKKTEVKFGVQREIQNLEKQIEKAETQLRILVGKIERQLADIAGVKEHLQQNDNTASQSQAEKEQANEKINILRGKLSEVKEEMTNVQRELKKAEESKYNSLKGIESLRTDLGELEQNKRRLEVTLAGTRTKGSNNLLKYGQYTQELLHAIEEAAAKNCFHRKPVGPCGMHVTLTGNPKWARAVESVTGGLMTTYRCDNQKDFQVLSRIMERICGKKHPTIIIGKFLKSRHDVESRRVSVRGFHSVLDVLSFDNDVVFNTFIDQARIETILLFETDQQAASVLTNIQNVPKNLRMGLTLQSDQYFPAPNYRTYYGNPDRPLRYFDAAGKGVDVLKRLEAELKEANRAMVEKQSEIEKAKETSTDSCTAVERWKNKLKILKHEEGRIQMELNHLKDIEDTRPVAIMRVALEEELESLEKGHEESSAEAGRCRETLERLKQNQKDSIKKLNSVALEEDEAEKGMREWEERLEEKRSKQRKLLGKRKGAGEMLEELNKKLREVEAEVRKVSAAVEERTKAAEEVCPERVETERSPVEVQRLLEKCEKYLKAAEKMAGSREATIAEYKTKIELFKEMKKMGGLLEKAIETLTMAAFKREQNLNILESHTASLVSLYFQATLQTRGYDGQLKVDFESKVLDLEVKPKDASIARKDSKTLSGGERSYSTVSFILAIWKVVHMPVYFLDEFDVFMDKVNRKVIMDLLLEHANVQSNKQFVFITPQDISSIRPSDIISVYRLPDPERKTN